jgi:hypothetical protein
MEVLTATLHTVRSKAHLERVLEVRFAVRGSEDMEQAVQVLSALCDRRDIVLGLGAPRLPIPTLADECNVGEHSRCPGRPPQKGVISILCLCPCHVGIGK